MRPVRQTLYRYVPKRVPLAFNLHLLLQPHFPQPLPTTHRPAIQHGLTPTSLNIPPQQSSVDHSTAGDLHPIFKLSRQRTNSSTGSNFTPTSSLPQPTSFFFHEYGRRVGMVPRSSLKEGKYSQMVEKRTKTTTQQTTKNQNKPQPKGRASTIL